MTGALEDLSIDVKKVLSRQLDQEQQAILEWLTPIDYASQQSDIINRRQEGTGLWLLTSEEFQEWVNQGRKTLFCPGIPGAGKTMMSSIVVDHLIAKFRNDADVGIAYIYCNYQPQQEQRPADLLLSLLKQLAQQQPAMLIDVKNLYEHHRAKGTRPSFDEIIKVLHSTIRLYSKVFIIIDALDEYHASNNEGLNRLLSGVFGLQDQVQLNLFATSRFVLEITSLFDGCILKEIRAQDDDILCYVNGRIHELLRSQISKHPQVQDTVRRDIVNAVDGMYVVLPLAHIFSHINVNIRFLLARLHMDSLKSQPTLGDIKRALRNLPQGMEGLDETYKQAIKRIEGQEEGYRKLAKGVLAWVTHAKRALYTAEVQHALAVNVGMAELDEDFLPEVEILGSICAGLVTIDKKSDVIRLVHYTTQEYFERTSSFPNAETDITATCVTYLSFNTFATGFCPTDKQFEARLKLYRLYDYAARNWGHHARATSAVEQLVVDFLKNEAKVSSSGQAMMASESYSGYSQRVPRQMKGVHIAAFFGLREAMMALLENGHDSDPPDSHGRTPLSYTASRGHEAVGKLLLEKGAELETKDSEYSQTPLSWAAQKGHEAVVKLLLEKGAELESKDSYSRTPLLWAAENGHEAVVKLLLEKGAELETKDWAGQTPLSRAAQKGYEAVVKLLLEKGAELESKDSEYSHTPLSWAVKKEHEAVVKLLLEKGAELESKDSKYSQTPLSWAAENGHEAVVKLLLEKGAELESNDNNDQTPLSWAAENGHEAVVKLLLEKGAELETKDSHYSRTPLSWAAPYGHEAVVELLLEKGAELETKDSQYSQTPLLWAAENGHEAVVKLLLEKGAELETKDRVGRTPLSWAAQNGHKAVVELLLEKGAELESNDNKDRTPLLWAAENGHEALVKLLLEKGAELETKDKVGRTPLSRAAEDGHEAVVKLLLEKGAELETKDSNSRTPLLWAAENGHEAVVKLLLEKGAELETKDSVSRTPLL